ncbi:uncharacterized protein AMSG_01765 [Thecamonas trahens ATCC 50062]|uniref:Mitochondrial import inner membrane translocase subunit TIM22 n=1 Tax=Thecamonas trahens ATCC 50062 TaxID=461836 RepID=A0A0L0DTA3_THETB|nr:hypothetical protein AMSG_01765 [Thecamonas trahens ATCC 50062]KNC55500.1 hypothetical protein AMSG_01765 [Thecamonas trahens ATCC 50062]|eukprot:XP_013761280.1 hypothetical protein AMSG_01765 [Thecamonas trahens ATCC 50062]
MASDSCVGRTGTAAAAGLVGGGMFGAISAAWNDAPVLRGQSSAALRNSFGVIRSQALLFASVSAVFAASECVVRSVRNKNDAWNAVIAGCAAGSTLGVRSRSLGASVAGCVSLAALMAAVEATGGKLYPAHTEPAPSYVVDPKAMEE